VSTPARVWLLVRRLLGLLFVCGCVVSLWTSGRLSVRLVADGMISLFFVPLFQFAAFALVYRRAARSIPFADAADAFFAGNRPWLVFLAAFAALRSLMTAQQAGAPPSILWRLVQLAVVGVIVWSAAIDRRYFRDVLSGPADATRDLIWQRAIGWIASLGYFYGIALWPEIAGRIW
jgi:hypothetical protein